MKKDEVSYMDCKKYICSKCNENKNIKCKNDIFCYPLEMVIYLMRTKNQKLVTYYIKNLRKQVFESIEICNKG